MRALVVGGSRFIGLHLVRTLSKEGHSVTVLNRGQTEVTFPGGVERLYADRNDSSQVEAALHGKSFDTVFDISAYTPSVLGLTVKALQGNIGHYSVLQHRRCLRPSGPSHTYRPHSCGLSPGPQPSISPLHRGEGSVRRPARGGIQG